MNDPDNNATIRPVWRSMLFAPADQPRFLSKIETRGADAIQVDLEDGVLPENKNLARESLKSAVQTLHEKSLPCIIRINRPWRLAVPDLEAAVLPDVSAIGLPKVPNASHIQAIGEIVTELEIERGIPEGTISFIAMIETPEGALNIPEIAKADDRLSGIIVGVEDFSLESGISLESPALAAVHIDTVLAARAAGIAAYGFVGSISEFKDLEKFARIVTEARHMGFDGAFCIHPAQVPVLNSAFSPSDAEISHAEAVIAAFSEARTKGLGAIALNGKMIDKPVVERAKATLNAARRFSV